MKIYLDYETKSDIPIKNGTYNYLKHPSADVVCMAFAMDNGPVHLWTPGYPFPFKDMPSGTKFYAHNAWFDLRVWNWLCHRLYNWPINRLENWVDAMALCGRWTFPQQLEKVGEALNLPIKKNPRGKHLINKICSPPYKYTEGEMNEFKEYCINDVSTLRSLCQHLPNDCLSDNEQAIWELTCRVNSNGLPMDIDIAEKIYKITRMFTFEKAQQLPGLTNQVVTKPTQVQRIVKWVNDKGIKMSNCQAATIEKMLALELPDDVQTVLEIRRDVGLTSVAKYKKIIDLEYKGWVHDNLRYYGANTGRWGGLGFQIHNLPRKKFKRPEKYLKLFREDTILDDEQYNPIDIAKGLVRPMIKAPKGYTLCVYDFSSIEYILLCWVTQDWAALKRFAEGYDQYIDMASFLYSKSYKEVTELERFVGKVIILGCGYGLGAKGFTRVADSWGIDFTDEKYGLPKNISHEKYCKTAVDNYRKMYHRVPNLWYKGSDCAVSAVKNPGIAYTYNNCKFKVVKDRIGTSWLTLLLPSRRYLVYNSPEITEGLYGPNVSHKGINPYTKKWSTLNLIPGRVTENIIQALARDILAQAKLNLYKEGYKILASIHDEIILLIPVTRAREKAEKIRKLMCTTPDWGQGLPLRATGYIAKRYRKE